MALGLRVVCALELHGQAVETSGPWKDGRPCYPIVGQGQMKKAAVLDTRDTRSLVQQIYRGSTAADPWRGTLRALRDFFSGAGSVLARYDYGTRQGSIVFADGLNKASVESYNQRFHEQNPWFHHGPIMTLGDVTTGDRLIPEGVYLGSDFYNEWMKPQNLFHVVRGVIYRNEAEIIYVAVQRPREAGKFNDREVQQFQGLIPHLQRAITDFELLSRLRTVGQGALAALDVVPLGIAIFDADGRPILVNQTGREILNEGDGLRLRLTGVQAVDPGENARLRAALDSAVDVAKRAGEHAFETLAVSRPSGRRPISVSICPLPLNDPIFQHDRPAVIVVFNDTERQTETDKETLRQFYGLTPAEARLAQCLVKGQRLDEAAAALHITSGTARTHLKHIFSKTETTRQAELVSLMLSGPGKVRTFRQDRG